LDGEEDGGKGGLSRRDEPSKNQYINLLIENVKWILEDLRMKMFDQALADLYWFVAIIDVTKEENKKRLQELEQEIEDAQKRSTTAQGIDTFDHIQKQSNMLDFESRKLIRNAIKTTFIVLHTEGYLAESHIGLWFPSLEKLSGKGTYPGAPEMMSSEVK
jgi:hypothetical protein